VGLKDNKPVPKALYGCRYENCADDVSHRPEDLFWSDVSGGWVCDDCYWYHTEEQDVCKPTLRLSDYLQAHDTADQKELAELRAGVVPAVIIAELKELREKVADRDKYNTMLVADLKRVNRS